MRATIVPLLAAVSIEIAAAKADDTVPVTVDNFVRAESDLYMGNLARDAGGTGKFLHHREVSDIANQAVIRLNRDTLYSAIVLDLDAGPATITLPDAGDRFMSMQLINEDQYTVAVNYGAGSYPLSREAVGTRYLVAAIRTLVDPNDPDDVKAVHALQDAIAVDQPGGPGRFEVPDWDPASQKTVRDALIVLAATIPDMRGAFGAEGQVDPVRRLLGAAAAWGGNPDKDAIYLNVTPAKNDGTTVHRLVVPADVPVDGFWSVSRYNKDGYYQPNDLNAYTFNSLTAAKGADGAATIQFGGCDGKVPNCLPVEAGWNYMVRLYRPHAGYSTGRGAFLRRSR
jgi:hypothetical protein